MFSNRFIGFWVCLFFFVAPLWSWRSPIGWKPAAGPVYLQEDTGKIRIELQEPFKIGISNDGKERQFPFIFKFDNDVFISYSEHPDVVVNSPVDALLVSHDNGKSWTKKITHADFYITSMVEKNGVLYGVVYFTYPSSKKKERMIYWTSSDHGNTWTKQKGIVHSGPGLRFTGVKNKWGNLLFHRGMMVTNDGAIEGVMYGHLRNEKKYSCVWVKSTDNCRNWKIVSVIASGVPRGFESAEGYCEPAFSNCADGSILCVMRIGSYHPLFQCRSKDGGKTWSTPRELPGLKPLNTESVCPQLLLLKNGILALTYGRPGDKLAFSTDGSGYSWDCSVNSYEKETTGYSGIVALDDNLIFLVSDQGRTGAKEPAIWGRIVNIERK